MTKEGILLVDKERGKTAFFLVILLRKLTHIKKIGHTGTLDPFATGLMVMLIGSSYTKLSSQLMQEDKEYLATLKLGEETDTYDCDGKVVATSTTIPTLLEIQHVLTEFQGSLLQTPPMYSAKKVGGKKLYELIRKGIEVPRNPVPITVKIDLLEYAYPFLKIKVACSKGTYIRSLAHDIGNRLGSKAHLIELIRTQCGKYSLRSGIKSEQLKDLSFPYENYLL